MNNTELIAELEKLGDASEYEKQAETFLQATNTMFSAVLIGHSKYFDDDKHSRDIYQVTLNRQGRPLFSCRFGQSIRNSGFSITQSIKDSWIKPKKGERRRIAPTAYDVLACLTTYEPGTILEFCSNYGYDHDSIKANKIYKDVCEEYNSLRKVYSLEELEAMQTIN